MLRRQIFLSSLVFIVSVLIGLWIASHKPLWNDEFYSLVMSTQLSYGKIIAGHVGEGNNCPLFYLLQKSFFQIAHYHFPQQWLKGSWQYPDSQSWWIVRILPIGCMSLSITLVFFLFYQRYSWKMGLYSLAMYFSSYMLWVYWAEARPYALIVLLTTVQIYLLVHLIDHKTKWERLRWPLAAVHLLLSFTFILSLGQIVAASIVVWILRYRNFKDYLALIVLPMLICFYYYAHAPQYLFWFNMSPEQLVRDSFPRWELYMVLITTICILGDQIKSFLPFGKNLCSEALIGTKVFLFFTYAILASTALILILFTMKASPNHQGFTVASRYFIYLMPIGVVAAVWFSRASVLFFSNYRWIQMVLIATFTVLLSKGFYKIAIKAIQSTWMR